MATGASTCSALLDWAIDRSAIGELVALVRARPRVAVASGLVGGARAFAIAALQRATGRPVFVVVPDAAALENFRRDVEFFVRALNGVESAADLVLTLPASEGDPYDGTSPHPEILEERARTLMHLARGTVPIVAATVRGAVERTQTPEAILDLAVELAVGSDARLEIVVDTLLAGGYRREDPVGAPGEFSVRGGILDVFPPGSDDPVRVEFFGDTVDSIRSFDPDTQRSIERIRTLLVPPMRELADRRQTLVDWSDAAPAFWTEPHFLAELRQKLAAAERGESFPGWERLTPLVTPLTSCSMDFLAADTLVVVDEPADIERHVLALATRFGRRFDETRDNGELALPPDDLFVLGDRLRGLLDTFDRLDLRVLGKSAARVDAEFELDGGGEPGFFFPLAHDTADVHVSSQAAPRYHGRVADLAEDLRRTGEAGGARLLVMPSLGVAERVVEMLAEYGVSARLAASLADAASEPPGRAVVAVGRLGTGLRLPAPDLAVLVETDLFASAERHLEGRRAQRKRRAAASAFLSDFRDLKHGDFVVHVDHGIGRFAGLVQMPAGDGRRAAPREFMLLTYADEARLYVPVERLDLVQKHSAAEGHQPHVDRLGGTSWSKTKQKTTRAMRDMAEELLKLYAERRLVGGHAFLPDGPWQHEFEDAFEYQLTDDQDAAIADVKADMEQSVPMDRLLCGDVGYGKTEVAMRSVFKSVMEGKQVAVLAPTTVLVFQHFKTLTERFAAFPVRIDMLSRFRSTKEQKATVEALAAGSADVVVGTHRLLTKDVRFRDLGLVVVDEEQRFGVTHKERLKQLRKRVDVLSMSATPIPRTLNMSLAGLRDMSVIETPPRDRLAIQTVVVPFSEQVARSSIEQELARGGQVFFVHNRVETIFTIADLLHRIVPSARIGVGHGQMDDKALEDVMLRFVRHDLDVLVSTTIIENGIDIPLANTIVINRADTFGLAQLYQLRGRVGRSSRQAYAFLLIPSEAELTPIARKRLAAIREFADLGAGFRIAALDLELRGAGNLLGGQQSGFINAVGFDLYCQMLDRAVREMRGERIEDEAPTTSVNLGVDVRIPEDYVYDINQRLRTYKRISAAADDASLDEARSEVADRYGPLPASVRNLFEFARVRNRASSLGLASIDVDRGKLAVKLGDGSRIPPERLLAFLADRPETASFTASGVLRVDFGSGIEDDAGLLGAVERLLRELETSG